MFSQELRSHRLFQTQEFLEDSWCLKKYKKGKLIIFIENTVFVNPICFILHIFWVKGNKLLSQTVLNGKVFCIKKPAAKKINEEGKVNNKITILLHYIN